MAGAYKTPGVYIVEKNAFPNSVVEVATAVPAFIGYTEKADNKGSSLLNKPWRITSMAEFEAYFGGAPKDLFNIVPPPDAKAPAAATEATDTDKDKEQDKAPPAPSEPDFKVNGKGYTLQRQNKKADTQRYYLYRSMQLFFANGGGPCYIVSVGAYAVPFAIEVAPLTDGIDLLLKEQEPTMVVIPDAMALDQADGIKVYQASLKHCGVDMRNRFALIDIHNGFNDETVGKPVGTFRNSLGTTQLKYAAAYYPWLNTVVTETAELGFDNFADLTELTGALKTAHAKDTDIVTFIDQLTNAERIKAFKDKQDNPDLKIDARFLPDEELHKILFAVSPTYVNILTAIKRKLNLLPPGAAMAGVYTLVDNLRGVWKAPANVSLAAVVSPAVNISHNEQEGLNVDTAGKSINAIRSFIGEGVLVWGARTLDGNSLDWRYINVRRTMIMIEESLRLATKAYVFEPNVSGTWVTIKGMANNFLTSVWKRGGLAGASPEDAFNVSVGLGETMTAEDILEGILRVTILVAVSRPAEFIEITFQQQMQKS
jgi:phage tail sheath protein FI